MLPGVLKMRPLSNKTLIFIIIIDLFSGTTYGAIDVRIDVRGAVFDPKTVQRYFYERYFGGRYFRESPVYIYTYIILYIIY